MARNLIPKNDAEANVLTYRAMEEPLRKAYKRYADKTAKGMLSKIGNILTAAGYDGTNKATIINRPADPSTLRALEQMIEGVSDDRTRRKLYSKLYGQIGGANLTVRNAIRDVTEFGRYQDIDKLYSAGRRPLMDVAKEGMLRGEFMVQKQVGLAWSMQSPGIQQVESFLSKRWTHNDVVAYMQPLSKIVEDQVSQGLLLGEHPSKIAERIKNVEPINDVRANRNARTLTNAVANDAHTQSYKKHGVKRYEFVATFDERTCPVCGSLDGKTFPLDSKSVGTNYPPLHPNCRCTTVAALSKELKQKLYDDFEVKTKDGEVKRINANTTYDDWIKGNIKPTPVPPAPSEKKKKAQSKREERFSKDAEAERVKALPSNTYYFGQQAQHQIRKDVLKDAFAQGIVTEDQYKAGMKYLDTHGVAGDDLPETFFYRDYERLIGEDNVSTLNKMVDKRYTKWQSDNTAVYLRKKLVDNKVEYNPVKVSEKQLTEEEIIKKLGNADKTRGSCVSQAFAYAGNKAGLDVVDFRGGGSCNVFSGGGWHDLLRCKEGGAGQMIGVTDTKKLLNTMEDGEEYFLVTGNHCSIVRKGADGPEYLELQSIPEDCGWKNMEKTYGSVSDALKLRFGVKGRSSGGMINVKDISQREDVLEVLGYINTDTNNIKAGAGGGIK